jgi:hypothetical protein
MEASVVAHLGAAVGSTLAHLELVECRLSVDFWPAVWAHLPGLKTLTISNKLSSYISPSDLAEFCSAATHPLQLRLGQDLYVRFMQEDQVQEWVTAQGKPLVTVKQHG